MHARTQRRPGSETPPQSRVFDPYTLYGDDVDLGFIEVCSDDDEWTYVACEQEGPCPTHQTMQPHIDELFVAVDGACRGNGTADARGAIGVFFGKRSSYNQSVLLTETTMTNQVAELRAGILALHQAQAVLRREGEDRLTTLVVKADSDYLVRGMTEWVFKWERNGYRTSKGGLVQNRGLFQQLHGLVNELSRVGVEVLFWHVERGRNQDADRLANAAFTESL